MTWAIKEKSTSQRRACALIGLDPKTYRYASRRSDDVEIRDRLKTLAGQRRRFGYRRLHILLRREGRFPCAGPRPDLAHSAPKTSFAVNAAGLICSKMPSLNVSH